MTGHPPPGEPVFAFGAMEEVHASTLGLITEGIIAQRLVAAAVPGEHVWVVGMAFLVEDPEMAMDDMHLGADNLAGTYGIHCIACTVQYPRQGGGALLAPCPGPGITGRLRRRPS